MKTFFKTLTLLIVVAYVFIGSTISPLPENVVHLQSGKTKAELVESINAHVVEIDSLNEKLQTYYEYRDSLAHLAYQYNFTVDSSEMIPWKRLYISYVVNNPSIDYYEMSELESYELARYEVSLRFQKELMAKDIRTFQGILDMAQEQDLIKFYVDWVRAIVKGHGW